MWLKYCPRCGYKIPSVDNVRYCLKCGLDLVYIKEHKSFPPKKPEIVPTYWIPRKKLSDDQLLNPPSKSLWKSWISIVLPLVAFAVMNVLGVVVILVILLFMFDLQSIIAIASSPLFFIVSTLIEFILILFPLLYVGKFIERPTLKNRLELLGFTTKRFSKIGVVREILIGLSFAVIGVFLVSFVSIFVEILLEFIFNVNIVSNGESIPSSDVEIIISSASIIEVVLLVLVMIFVVGTSEEILFRGFMQRGLVRTLGNRWGLIVTALIFASIHLVGFLLSYFMGAIDQFTFAIVMLLSFFPYFSISILLGLLYLWRKENLIAVMVTHGVYNSLTLILAYSMYSTPGIAVLTVSVFIIILVASLIFAFLLNKYDIKHLSGLIKQF